MLKSMYTMLTAYEGVYIFYLVPIIYGMTIVSQIILFKRSCSKRIGIQDILAVIAIGLIALDFISYLYLFLSRTGKLLPQTKLFLKYMVGSLAWLWLLWYSYAEYFAGQVAGEQCRTRYLTLAGVGIGSLVLAGIGMIIS